MKTDPAEHVAYKIINAKVHSYPFPHFYVENVFPDDFYWQFIHSLPSEDSYDREPSSYANRRFGKPDFAKQPGLLSQEFTKTMLTPFRTQFHDRFPDTKAHLSTEWRLVRDGENYSIGPHTDAPWKVLSLLFYLPHDHSDVGAGTSIYVPEDHATTCEGGPHYKFDGFKKVWTAPYLPNSCLGFWKTPYSWHGVEPISRKMTRDVLLFNVYDAEMRAARAKPKPETTKE